MRNTIAKSLALASLLAFPVCLLPGAMHASSDLPQKGGHAAAHAGAAQGTPIHRFSVERLAQFHGFDATAAQGMNRNAFGSAGAWDRWARLNWGAGWNDWGAGWGDWAGPVFWPFLYGDALTFALWPDALDDPFFAYGPDYLLASIFWPGPLGGGAASLFDIYGSPPQATRYESYYHRRHPRDTDATQSDSATCGGVAPGLAHFPIDAIAHAIKPSDQQTQLLDALQAASTKADEILRASCPSDTPLTPVGRLDAVSKRLHAMRQALSVLQPPLVALDQSLNDPQREKLAALGGRSRYRHAGVAMSEAPARDLAALCKGETAHFTALPVQRIDTIVKPTVHQKTAFDALKSASTTAAQNLDASCPYDMPETLKDRLDAVGKRLDALNDAVTIVKPALRRFYETLSDEQKARFNIIGNDADAAASDGT
jgi:hypothetical protein